MGLIVTDGRGFFSEEKRHADHSVAWLADGVPAFRLTNTCTARALPHREGDPDRPEARRAAAAGSVPCRSRATLADYHAVRAARAAPRQPRRGQHGLGRRVQGRAHAVRRARRPRAGAGLLGAVAATLGRVRRHLGRLAGPHAHTAHDLAVRARRERQRRADRRDRPRGARRRVRPRARLRPHRGRGGTAGARQPAGRLRRRPAIAYVGDWQQLAGAHRSPLRAGGPHAGHDAATASAPPCCAPTRPSSFPAASIASLSIPGASAKGDDDLGGYHLVWPRDLVETAGGLLAAGATRGRRAGCCTTSPPRRRPTGTGRRTCGSTARPTGTASRWTRPRFPILLVDLARREGALEADDERAVLADGAPRRGVPGRERAGHAAGPLGGGSRAIRRSRWRWRSRRCSPRPTWPRRTASRRSPPTCARRPTPGTTASSAGPTSPAPTSRASIGVDGYYVRIAPPEVRRGGVAQRGLRADQEPPRRGQLGARGVRSSARTRWRWCASACAPPDDPRIVDTVKVIDALLKVETPSGPAWHRYNDDGYGEHEDGAPFDGTGIGRAWPLLTGERAHYELAAGRRDEAAAPAARARGVRQRRRPAPRAGLGRARPARAGAVLRPAVRLGDAAGLGARGVRQAAPLARATGACSTCRRRPCSGTSSSGARRRTPRGG